MIVALKQNTWMTMEKEFNAQCMFFNISRINSMYLKKVFTFFAFLHHFYTPTAEKEMREHVTIKKKKELTADEQKRRKIYKG